ncbi:MAG: metallophosphoesterase family protein, partial [bacterium]
MQILAVSDIHGDLAQMAWIAEQEPGLLLIAGDLAGRHENRREVADWLKTLPFPVAICSGNHDWDGGIQW